ncbi:hypothetical protein ACLQ26_20340 [Micromonospora sp. DT43]|uniref:hypothetical protein n=1 Tax=Micromonospora sp. DT43 TaxID=3393440 RepID=UPI003CEDB79B
MDVLRERGHAATAVARTARVGGTGLLVRLDHDCFHQPWEGDLDFVVTPHTITSDSTDARTLLEDIRTAIRTATGAGVQQTGSAVSGNEGDRRSVAAVG